MVTSAELSILLAVLQNEVKTLKRDISKHSLEMMTMRKELTEMKISQARNSVIVGLTQAVGTGLILWIFRSALVGG